MICAQVHSKHEVQYKNAALLDDFYQFIRDLNEADPDAILYYDGDWLMEAESFVFDRKHLQEFIKHKESCSAQTLLVVKNLLNYSDERHNAIYVDVRD
jgi:hypothetical protein